MASSPGEFAGIGSAALLVDSLTWLSFSSSGLACPFLLCYSFVGFAPCEHELCGGCTISTGIGCVVLLYVGVGFLACHTSGSPRGFYSVAGMVYCSLPEFMHLLPFFVFATI